MLYQREINDPVLIQFIILYTLNQAKDYVPYNNLINLVLEIVTLIFKIFKSHLIISNIHITLKPFLKVNTTKNIK